MKTINNDVILKGCCSGSQPCKQRDHEQRHLKMTGTFGFTLVELLVVVLIIGVLSAIAIPMYQGAVDKSHWSTMLPGAKALKDAEEAVRMSNGLYTANMENLDVRMPNGDVQYTLETVNDDGSANVVRATNTKLPTVRLSNYLDENVNFGGQLHCEAKDNDERATRLCEKLLGGQYIMPVDGGYTAYLLDQEIDQATCNHAEQSWSTSKTKCYKDTATRCEALGMDVVTDIDDQCGYKNQSGNKKQLVIGKEGLCLATQIASTCTNLFIEKGGICKATAGDHSLVGCTHSDVEGIVFCNTENASYCGIGNTYNGGICVGNALKTCWGGKFNNGSICYGNVQGNKCGEKDKYDETSCCCGICGTAPKCADRGITCDPQYMK